MNGLAQIAAKLASLKPADVAAKAAPAIEAKVRALIAGKSFPAREDGTASTANDLAGFVSVVPEGNGLTVRIDHPAAEFLQDGTSKMDPRELINPDELREIVQPELKQAMSESLK